MAQQHLLERRATMLAGAIKKRVSDISQSLVAPGGRILFRTKLSEANALDWWSKNRYNPIGQQAVAQMDPLAVAQLDAALTQHTQQQAALGLPQIGGPPNA